MHSLQDCFSSKREIIEQREGSAYLPEGIVFMDPAVAVYELDDERFWLHSPERPDGLVVGRRADGHWWVCFVELKHCALPEGFQALVNQIAGIVNTLENPEFLLSNVIRKLIWNIEELQQLNRGQEENLDDAYQPLIANRAEHHARLAQEVEKLKALQAKLETNVQQIQLAEACSKALGAHTKSLILKARHQLLSGVWHFAYHSQCCGAGTFLTRHGDAHHNQWARGHDLPPGMTQGDQLCKDHSVAAVIVLLQRSGSRSLAMLPSAPPFIKASNEDVCVAKPVPLRILVTHLQAKDGRFLHIFDSFESFCQLANLSDVN